MYKHLKKHIQNINKKTNNINHLKNNSKNILASSIKKLINYNKILKTQQNNKNEKAFLCRQLIQVTLPHSNPGCIPIWTRKNNNLLLSIKQGYEKGKPIGYPFGSIPRLLIFWMTKEALRNKSRIISLGDNLASFMREIGLSPSGGKRGNSTRLKTQMKRLFRADISLEYDYNIPNVLTGTSWVDMKVAKKGNYWWNLKKPYKSILWEKWIELDKDFYNAITTYPVPLNVGALKILKNSAMALDLYAWVTWRAFAAQRSGKSQPITWQSFNKQLGANYNDLNNLRKKCKIALKKIKQVYPGLKIESINGGFNVLPSSKPSVINNTKACG